MFRSSAKPLVAPAAPDTGAVGVSPDLNALSDAARRGLLLLNEIIDLLPVGVSLQDGAGRYLFANEFARRFVRSIDFGPAPLAKQTAAGTIDDRDFSPVVADEFPIGADEGRTLLRLQKSGSLNGEPVTLSAFMDISERKQIERELSRRADFDELTGLANRLLIERQIQDLIRESDSRFAVAFVDIDDFKQINDYYGHVIGDALLVQLARRIAGAISKSDRLARLGGDEFLLLIRDFGDGGAVASVINQIVDEIKQPFIIDAYEIWASASIGVTLYPNHGLDYKTLLHNADSAMYQIKRDKKGGAALFNPKIEQSANERVHLEQRLRLAIRDRRFRCAFQPKVDIYSGDVVGVEALIRLLDENGDVQKPNSFIHLAIELGLIDDLTQLAATQIVSSIDQIDDAFGPEATISLNVAAKQASNVDFMRSIVETLESTPSVGRFIIEVTEDAFVVRSQFQAAVLPMLREAGLRVSIDDFGTGYSSLSALADITADELKIDRSFITNIHERKRNQSILKAIESLANALGMTVIAEGVESAEELNYLRTTTRIRFAQGFYYAKPIFLEETAALGRSDNRSRTAMLRREAMGSRAGRRRSR
jgi:cyclic di-GMP phosphodiesterase Gmr